MFEAGSYKDDCEKEAWKKIMMMDFMSSDESCTKDILVSNPLLW